MRCKAHSGRRISTRRRMSLHSARASRKSPSSIMAHTILLLDSTLIINPHSKETILQNSSLRSPGSRACSMLLKTETCKRRCSHTLLIVCRDSLMLFLHLKLRLDLAHIIWLNQFYHLQLYQLQLLYNRSILQLKNLKRSSNRQRIVGLKLHNQCHLFQQEIRCFFFLLKKRTKI